MLPHPVAQLLSELPLLLRDALDET